MFALGVLTDGYDEVIEPLGSLLEFVAILARDAHRHVPAAVALPRRHDLMAQAHVEPARLDDRIEVPEDLLARRVQVGRKRPREAADEVPGAGILQAHTRIAVRPHAP